MDGNPGEAACHGFDTPRGEARGWSWGVADRGRLVLGHGAGGAPYLGAGGAARPSAGRFEPDLLAARDAGLAAGLEVLLVEQPWRVSGRRVAEAPARLDEAWLAVLAQLPPGVPTVLGGRSAGARVACRTSAGAVGVLALAFPLQPPRATGRPVGPSRATELDLSTVPVLVVQGDRDVFGVPVERPGRTVTVVRGGDHAFVVRKKDRNQAAALAEVREAVGAWLATLPGLRR